MVEGWTGGGVGGFGGRLGDGVGRGRVDGGLTTVLASRDDGELGVEA